MIAISLAAVVLAASIYLIARVGLTAFNPALVAGLAWLPAICLASIPVTINLGVYAHLNEPITPYALLSMSLGLLGMAAGAFLLRNVSAPKLVNRFAPELSSKADPIIAVAYVAGLATFLYAYWQSGLLEALCGTPTDIAASQQQFHIRHLSLLVLLLDLASLLVAARMLMTGRMWLLIPTALPIALYLMTFQKSRVLFLLLCLLFVAIVFHREARAMFLSSARSIALLLLVGVALGGSMYATNLIRGVGVLDPNSPGTICRTVVPIASTQDSSVGSEPAPSPAPQPAVTSIQNGFLEQAFIYLGAPAIRNLSATLEGTVASDAPTYGRIVIRTLLWPFADRETLNPTRHLGGINNGTALIFYWHDFGIAGIAALSFAAGVLAMFAFGLARHKSLFGLLAGAIAFNACAMSVFTDMFFEPLTAVQFALAALVHGAFYLLWRIQTRTESGSDS